jgi:hypothetical protein
MIINNLDGCPLSFIHNKLENDKISGRHGQWEMGIEIDRYSRLFGNTESVVSYRLLISSVVGKEEQYCFFFVRGRRTILLVCSAVSLEELRFSFITGPDCHAILQRSSIFMVIDTFACRLPSQSQVEFEMA